MNKTIFMSSYTRYMLLPRYSNNISNKITRHIHVIKTIPEMLQYRKSLNSSSFESLGFVPTMGALHLGHLSLIQKAINNNNKNIIVSIFVNPTQFSKGEDLDKYPRQLEADLELLKSVGANRVFAPQASDMYPSRSLCHVEPADFSHIHEGQVRPDFFRGVATVVCKLFNIVRPTDSYFGQKDISQCILIKKMVEDLNISGTIHICETMREPDGLAMSSRNVYLNQDERQASSILYKALSDGKYLCETSPSVSRDVVVNRVCSVLQTNPLVSKIEYVSLASSLDMKELSNYNDNDSDYGAVLSCAVRIGSVRLIDNLLIGKANKYVFNQ